MNQTQPRQGGIIAGFLIGIGLGVIHAVIVLANSDIGMVFRGLRFFGLVQFVYMVPMFLFLLKRRPAMAAGLAIAASAVVLVNVVLAIMD